MAKRINWSYSVEVAGGTRVRDSQTIPVEAVDEIDLSIGTGQTEEVDVQPGGEGQVEFLLIRSKPPDAQVTYKVNDSGAADRTLDGPHLLIGKGATQLLDLAPSKLFITNGSATDPVSISILVGRDATP
jgi:hypothetical protein